MATVDELIKQYETDPTLKKEVDDILADQKITPMEFFGFVKKHNVDLTTINFNEVLEEAKKAGLIK